MPRRLFLKLRPIAARLRDKWYFKMLGPRLTDSRLWSVNRRGITTAFGTAIAISFIPLPFHPVYGLLAAMIWRQNLPTMFLTLLILNPLTAVALYYTAYRVGALALGTPVGKFAFELSFDWLRDGLGTFWKPFLVGCLICSIMGGFLGYRLLELVWRISTVNRLNAKRAGVREN
jgi:uncharacterized protein (DUF2062 family)